MIFFLKLDENENIIDLRKISTCKFTYIQQATLDFRKEIGIS